MLRRTVFRRAVALALLPLTLACSTWGTYRGPTDPRAELPDRVRLQLRSGDAVVLDEPGMDGDSVWVGVVDGEVARFPVLDVTNVEERRVSGGRTAFLVGGITVVLAGIGLWIWLYSELS